MAYEQVYRLMAREPQLKPFVSQKCFDRKRWSGVLELSLVIPEKHPVAIGSGSFDLHQEPLRSTSAPERFGGLPPGSQRRLTPMQRAKFVAREAPRPTARQNVAAPEVIAEIVRRGPARMVVLPGSSLKGAVRQVYEMLTASCELGGCQVDRGEDCPLICPACSLFGAGGLGGRLLFNEAKPGSVNEPLKRKVARAWTSPKTKRVPAGTFRIYNLAPAVDGSSRPLPEPELTWAVAGEFTCRLQVINADLDELGLLFASLGLGRSHGLRLGGKKFHGLGVVNFEIARAMWRYPEAVEKEGQEAMRWALEQQAWALRDPERNRVWTRLHKVISSQGGR